MARRIRDMGLCHQIVLLRLGDANMRRETLKVRLAFMRVQVIVCFAKLCALV